MQYVYFLTDGKFVKIGLSKNPLKRIKQLNTGNSTKLYMLGWIEGDRQLEQALHRKFKRVNGEWMEATEDLIAYMNSKLDATYVDWLGERLWAFKKLKG